MNDMDGRVTDGVRHLRLLTPEGGIQGHDRQQSALSQFCPSNILILYQISCLLQPCDWIFYFTSHAFCRQPTWRVA